MEEVARLLRRPRNYGERGSGPPTWVVSRICRLMLPEDLSGLVHMRHGDVGDPSPGTRKAGSGRPSGHPAESEADETERGTQKHGPWPHDGIVVLRLSPWCGGGAAAAALLVGGGQSPWRWWGGDDDEGDVVAFGRGVMVVVGMTSHHHHHHHHHGWWCFSTIDVPVKRSEPDNDGSDCGFDY